MSPDDQRRPLRKRRQRVGRSKRKDALGVVIADERGHNLRMSSLICWLQRVAPADARGTVSIALVSDGRARELNRTYRHRDYATDVLSFAGSNGSAPPRTQRTPRKRTVLPSASSVSSAVNDRTLGDIVIGRGVAQRQAREAGHSELTELKILALHGLLHLLGYDHEGDDGQMQRVEQRLRRRGGLHEGLIERHS